MLYVLKFSACLGILMLFYRFFLEKENMHRFKRFYLLLAILMALLIPLVTFTEYVEVAPAVEKTNLEVKEYSSSIGVQKEGLSEYVPMVLWSIYSFGLLLFGWQFAKNLVQIVRRIQNNPKYRTKNAIKVLLGQPIAPHTFFKYIFLNKQRYEAKEIPEAVLLHEETHVLQKHSLDVLFIELLQVFFWFNPLVYLAKRAIKLNHEFLADQTVIQKGISPLHYQKILLAFSSQALSPLPLTIGMANSINYSSIKKRISVMRTRTSKKSIVLRGMLLLPLLALLLVGFSETKIIQKDTVRTAETFGSKLGNPLILANQKGATKQQISEFNTLAKKYGAIPIEKRVIPSQDLKILETIFRKMSGMQRASALPFPECDLKTEIIQIEIDKKGAIRSAGNSVTIESLPTFLKKYNPELSKEEREKSVRAIIKVAENTPKSILNQVEQIIVAYGVAQINIEGPLTSSLPQDGATEDQIREYNAMVKRINAQPENRRIYKKKEVERLEFIFGLMSEQQKENALPFPEFPPMPEPPAPQAPKEAMPPKANRTPKQPIGVRYIKAPVAPETPEAPKVPEIEEPVMISVVEIEEVEPPEAPEPPMSPLDHVIELAKADAAFYYQDKKISSDKAIEILKKNDDVNIDVNAKDGMRPVVTLSKQPFVFDN